MEPRPDRGLHYLRWAKVHSLVGYELTGSGVPHAQHHDFEAEAASVSLEVQGTYGDPGLIEALSKRYGCHPEGVVPVPGANSANFIALAAAVDRGMYVAVERPGYDPIERAASLLGLRIIPLMRRPECDFSVAVGDVQSVLSRGARAVVLTNLHNPSGQLLRPEVIAEIAASCRTAGATLIVDEVYLDGNHLVLGQPLWTAASVADNVIAINSLTKVYGLGGLRVGWLMTNPDLAERARSVMDVLSVNNAAPSASLALAVLENIERLEGRYRRFYEKGRAVYGEWLAGEPLVTGYDSCGALFECVKLPDGITGDGVNDLLVAEYDTQVVPGRFFGLDDHFRISLAVPPAELNEGLARISRALARLTSGGDRELKD